jgi:hypothetical protein
MPDELGPLTDDQERMERYLVWRELDHRIRRRRRVRRALVVAAVGVVGVGLGAWLSSGVRHTASLSTPASPSADAVSVADPVPTDVTARSDSASRSSVAGVTDDVRNAEPQPAPPPVIERAPAPRAPKPAARRTARVTSRSLERAAAPGVRAQSADELAPPSAAPRDRSAASERRAPSDTANAATTSESAATSPGATTSDRATAPSAAVTPPTPDERRAPEARGDIAQPSTATPNIAAPTTPSATTAAPTTAPPPAAAPPVAQTPPVVVAPPVPDTPAPVAPGTVTSIASKPDCADLDRDTSPDGRTRSERVADCVGGWLKGQSREFRDGVTRGVDEFRGSVDKVGRGLQWLGGKLRRSE